MSQSSYPPQAQHSRLTVASIQQLWDEWEIQCLVLASFSLQVFLFFACFRKRYRFRVLSLLLWLAYLSADTVAVFILGRLTRVGGDDSLALFWGPFMLLHLGGQDTITAFSMEDCALWKRHLLNLTTQVALAIYVVGKQWQGDKQLVAPMVLIFISGMTKYVERIWILGRAGSWGPISRPWGPLLGQKRTLELRRDQQRVFRSLLFSSDKESWFHIEDVAHGIFYRSMGYFMNRTRKRYDIDDRSPWKQVTVTSSDEGVNLAYKLAEIQLSLIYDYLYTKFGSLDGMLHRLTILVINSTALALFVVHHKGVKGRSAAVNYHGVADVAISYILLVGAVTLEISSILMWLMTSYWPFNVCSGPGGGHSPRVVRSILKHLRSAPESNRLEWSGKLQQYNLMDEIIQKKAIREYGWLKWMMWHIGIKQDHHTTKHVAISPEVKKVFFHKLCDNHLRLDSTSFRAEWETSSSSGFGAAQQRVRDICQDMDLVSSAFVWHLVTDICLVGDETPSKFRTCSQHLSNYIMHLVYQCNLMVDAKGRLLFEEYIEMVGISCKHDNYDKRQLLQRVYDI